MEEWDRLWKEDLRFTVCYTLKEIFMLHMWWKWRKVKEFWERIHNEFKKIFKISFTKKNPEAFLLGIMGTDIPKNVRKIFLYATVAARMLIARNWKGDSILTKLEWQAKWLESWHQ